VLDAYRLRARTQVEPLVALHRSSRPVVADLRLPGPAPPWPLAATSGA